VNLIGEHTDYNDGFVLPIAINRRTYVAASPGENGKINIHSRNLNESAAFNIASASADHTWLKYIAGITASLQQRGVQIPGADLMIESDVPIGGGLSSSAALEVSVGKALLKLTDSDLEPIDLALAAQKAERDFVGIRCGIMDQLTAVMARAGHALLIDCRSLAVRHIPLISLTTAFVVCDTNVKHELALSAYNQRRTECETAVTILKQKLPSVIALRDVTVADFEKYEGDLPEPFRRRARHVVTENARTLVAAKALETGNLDVLGSLMKSSHKSLQQDYEVSSSELDTMVGLAWEHEGVVGARMTGGGFGGCTINLVRRDAVENFCDFIKREYRSITGIDAEAFVVEADQGAREEVSWTP
jgi:galactokinase